MPKRAYPFSETFSSQYKIHVGPQELNHCSVFGHKYRKEIYEKTKSLLFNGAKAVVGKIWTAEEKCTEPQTTGPADAAAAAAAAAAGGGGGGSRQTLLRGQTLIGHDGRLTKATRAQAPPTALKGCCVCQKSQGSRTLCAQCDRPACCSCTRQCSSCSSLCCSVCTVIDYSGRYDEVLCCSCST